MAAADDAARRWERVQEILGDALDCAPEERRALLDERCGDDTGLRAEVESLLAAADESDDYFDGLADRAGITLSPDTRELRDDGPRPEHGPPPGAGDLLGRRIGQYDVLEWLGSGGMASVYLAEREGDGFSQRVALKVVARKVDDPLIQRRSNDERRILARLEHSGIARLIDGGVTPDGHPFYAMEFVEGEDVIRYCDVRALSIDARLELFLAVCAPVQFAHERLVVHCDLKPSNIYVTSEGQVKLLDFGVARLIDPESVGSEVTGLWFTPAYASPEQVRRERPGTHSDVYSLGVLLYEMLTGHRPYRFGSHLREEILRTVGESVPGLPSAVVQNDGTRTTPAGREVVTASELAARRGATPESLRRRLRGDLDAIVMKALAKDPEDRYSTAEQLAADIRRHLTHRLVHSVTPTARYRAAKFLRRNSARVAVTAALVLVVGAGVGATLWQASRATRSAREAAAEAQKAAMVAELMSELFRLSDPTRMLGDTLTARDLLDQGTQRVLDEFGDQPRVQADLLVEVSRIYNNLGLYPRAEPLLRRALELRTAEFGPLSLESSEALIYLGMLQRNLSQQAEAIETLSRAIDVRAPLADPLDPLLVEARASLGWMVRATGEYDRAADLFAEAIEIQLQIDSSAAELADLRFGLAAAYHDGGLLEEADSLFREVLGTVDRARPSPNVIDALVRVGMVRRLREQYADAEPLLAEAVDMSRRLYGSAHGSVLQAQQEYGLTLSGLGRWEEAVEMYRPAIARSTEVLGEGHAVTARLQEGLASALEDLGAYDEAAELQILSLQEKILRLENRDHPGIVASLVATGRTLALAGRHREARDFLGQSDAMNARLGATESVYSISSERSRGIMATAEGDYATAEAHFQRAIELGEALLTRPTHRFLTGAKAEYADMLLAAGRTDEAVELLEEVLELRRSSLGPGHRLTEQTAARLRGARPS